MLKKNVGNLDRILRLVVGVVALVGFFMMPGIGFRYVLLIVGIIGVGTAALSSCPVYSIFGLRTCPMQKDG